MTMRRFGQSRKEAESFVASFEDVSVTQRLNMMGDDVRLFRCLCCASPATLFCKAPVDSAP